MLTIFTIPKAFEGHFGIIQRNAIKSWSLLEPKCQVILAGDDPGTEEAARDIGVEHIPGVARNEYGTPLLDSAYQQVEDAAQYPFICYVNADVMLMNDFLRAVQRVQERSDWFLMTARRWELKVTKLLDFGPDWQEKLAADVSARGSLAHATGIDFWVYPKKMLYDMPPLAVGRMAIESWCLYKARHMRADLIDSTKAVVSVHQDHDYSHHPGGHAVIGIGIEAERNRMLVGGKNYFFTIKDRTHELTLNKYHQPKGVWWAWRSLRTSPVLYPSMPIPLRLVSKSLNGAIDLTRDTLIKARNLARGH
ncbi:MAG: hypothetical protein FI717_00205 [SAR202 cluster bacterium]|nr:hypothetical protein [SAR202 cluster bacterium]